MISAFIFDLDGVIVDTAKYHYLAWKKIADELGLKFDHNDNELLKGVSRRNSLETILKLNGIQMSDEMIERYCAVKNDYYLDYINTLKEDEILPGVREFMEKARQQGFKLALGSASRNAGLILEKLEIRSLFDAIIDGTLVSKAKPDPEVFLMGSAELKVRPEECVVLEDSAAGITAAHNGNMKAVGVSNSSIRNICDYYIDGFTGIDAKVLAKKASGE